MNQDVKTYVEGCQSCNERKNPYRKGRAEVQQFQEAPGERIHNDIVGPLTATNHENKYILTCIDAFTRYPEIIALPNQKAETVARFFVKQVICRHGCPKILVTDNGTNFVSTLMKETCKLLNIDRVHTTAYHPQSNVIIERFHRSLKDMLYHLINRDQRNWNEWLAFFGDGISE